MALGTIDSDLMGGTSGGNQRPERDPSLGKTQSGIGIGDVVADSGVSSSRRRRNMGISGMYEGLTQGPFNAFSKDQINRFKTDQIEGLRKQQQQQLAGAGMAQAGRGGAGPDLSSIIGQMNESSNMEIGNLTGLAAEIEGMNLGVQQYGEMSNFVNEQLTRAHDAWQSASLAANEYANEHIGQIRHGGEAGRMYQKLVQRALELQAGFEGLMGATTRGQYTDPQTSALASFLLTNPHELEGAHMHEGEKYNSSLYNYNSLRYADMGLNRERNDLRGPTTMYTHSNFYDRHPDFRRLIEGYLG